MQKNEEDEPQDMKPFSECKKRCYCAQDPRWNSALRLNEIERNTPEGVSPARGNKGLTQPGEEQPKTPQAGIKLLQENAPNTKHRGAIRPYQQTNETPTTGRAYLR